jgi:hypothetical protein
MKEVKWKKCPNKQILTPLDLILHTTSASSYFIGFEEGSINFLMIKVPKSAVAATAPPIAICFGVKFEREGGRFERYR